MMKWFYSYQSEEQYYIGYTSKIKELQKILEWRTYFKIYLMQEHRQENLQLPFGIEIPFNVIVFQSYAEFRPSWSFFLKKNVHGIIQE